MGPWFIRDEMSPFLPGCSLATLRMLIRRGKVTRETILRGPSTRQFWNFARNVPGIANLFGECHSCHAGVSPDDRECRSCGASFDVLDDRERLGLSDVRLLPGHAAPEQIAATGTPNRPPAPPATSNGASPNALPRSGEDVPNSFEAETLIAARQRQRLGRQRRVMTVVVVVAAFCLVAIAASVAASRLSGRDRASPPTAPAKPNAAPAHGVIPETPHAETTPIGDEPLPPSAEPAGPAAAEPEIGRVLDSLRSFDLGVVAEALRETAADPPTSDLLEAERRAAEARVRVGTLGRRL